MEAEFIVGVLDKPNINGRIYPREVVEAAMVKYQKVIDEQRSIGCYDKDNTGYYATVNLSTASHLVTSMSIKDNTLVASMKILDTPCGKFLQEALAAKEISFRPVGMGELGEDNKTISSYELVSINAYLKKDCE